MERSDSNSINVTRAAFGKSGSCTEATLPGIHVQNASVKIRGEKFDKGFISGPLAQVTLI
jgi:hypothetical protein